jgi:hypothetical protein
MKIPKITLFIMVLICSIGIACAADLSDIKVADGFEDLGNGSYINEKDNIYLDIFTDIEKNDLKDFLENSSAVKYTTCSGKLNNTFNFTDGVNEIIGVHELVEINDTICPVEFSIESNADDTSLDRFYDALEEFNKLNNLTPIDPSTLK